MIAQAQEPAPARAEVESAIERYYRFHSLIYDATRWSFLFGRDRIIELIAQQSQPQPQRILEVGCGTGRNLAALARRFPEAQITGLDLSNVMLDRAKRATARSGNRVELVRACYDRPLHESPQYDVVLFSYALSMFNPGWDTAMESAARDLKPGGLLSVVDFHDSAFPFFKSWMGVNHVRMDSHLLPGLQELTQPAVQEERSAYAGVWKYLLYTGRKVS